MKYRSAFCTLNSVIRQLELATSTDNDLATEIDTLITTTYANGVARIKELIYEVSDKVYMWCSYRTFVPYIDTHTFRRAAFREAWHRDEGSYYLQMQDDILSISSITWVGASLSSTYYRLADENMHPNWRIEIDPDGITSRPSDFSESVQVVGVYGYHNNPDAMWLDSGDTVQDNPLSSSATTLNVSDGDNFETYQYIRIESEYLFITSISTNALTVERGVNGSTAAAHIQNTQIDTLQIDEVAESAVRRLVVMEYNNPGELGNIIPLPNGTVELNPESRITLPESRTVVRSF